MVLNRGENKIRPNGLKIITWSCLCDCGKLINVTSSNLRSGKTKSCGCLQKENASKLKSKYNTYDLSGEYGVGYTSKGDEFHFDLEDYDKIKDYCWRQRTDLMFDAKLKNGNNNQRILLHRLIMSDNLNNNHQIDHINHNRYDNRKQNLRVVNNSQNTMNRNIFKNNKSGHKGVIWHKRDCIWESYITFNNQRIYLGSSLILMKQY